MTVPGDDTRCNNGDRFDKVATILKKIRKISKKFRKNFEKISKKLGSEKVLSKKVQFDRGSEMPTYSPRNFPNRPIMELLKINYIAKTCSKPE